MANFVTTLSKLTGLADYPFQEICVKSTLVIIYLRAIFTAEDMLNALVFSQTTDVDEVIKRNSLGFQTLAVLNSTLPDNLLMYGQPNTEASQAYLQTFIWFSVSLCQLLENSYVSDFQ